jgi:hypothetical protein
MRNTATYLAIVCAMLFLGGCKGEVVLPNSNFEANNALIVAKYTITKKESSTDKVTWYDYTNITARREVLTLKSDKTYDSSLLDVLTGAVIPNMTGTWSLSNDGNTLTLKSDKLVNTQDNTIISLTPTTLVFLHAGIHLNNPYSSFYSEHNRLTYTRQ